MSDYEEQKPFVDVNFGVTHERIISFLHQFAPTYKGYLLDQTPKQLHSKEFILRIFYQDYCSITITCDSAEMIQQRIQNICNINNKISFINRNPNIETHTISFTELGKEEITIYYSAILEFEFTKV